MIDFIKLVAHISFVMAIALLAVIGSISIALGSLFLASSGSHWCLLLLALVPVFIGFCAACIEWVS